MLDFDREYLLPDRLTADSPNWLEQTIANIKPTGWAAEIYDADWRLVWISPELKIVLGDPERDDIGYGEHIFAVYSRTLWTDIVDTEEAPYTLADTVPYILYDSRDEDIQKALDQIDQNDSDHINTLKPLISAGIKTEPPPFFSHSMVLQEENGPGAEVQCMSIRVLDKEGNFVGTLRTYGPAIRASVLSLVARGDESMFERMSRLAEPGPQRVAILFADIDRSTDLSKRLPDKVHFEFIRELTQAIHKIIITHSGIVGKHAGDGTSAFFLADDHGAYSAAARAAIFAAKEIQREVKLITQNFFYDLGQNHLDQLDCKINIGLHWGDTVYMGQLISGGRLEVTALGDRVIECARIEQAASRGQILASKELVERLSSFDSKELNIDGDKIIYTPINTFDDIPDKSRKDAGNLAVVDLS